MGPSGAATAVWQSLPFDFARGAKRIDYRLKARHGGRRPFLYCPCLYLVRKKWNVHKSKNGGGSALPVDERNAARGISTNSAEQQCSSEVCGKAWSDDKERARDREKA